MDEVTFNPKGDLTEVNFNGKPYGYISKDGCICHQVGIRADPYTPLSSTAFRAIADKMDAIVADIKAKAAAATDEPKEFQGMPCAQYI